MDEHWEGFMNMILADIVLAMIYTLTILSPLKMKSQVKWKFQELFFNWKHDQVHFSVDW